MKDQNSIIADTSYLYALFNESDPYFFRAKKALEVHEHKEFITTCFVFAELYWLLMKRNFHLISKIFAAESDGIFKVVPFEPAHLLSIKTHSNKYQDRKIDIADASLISLAEKIGHGDILTTDHDFEVYRWNKTNTFTNFLLES